LIAGSSSEYGVKDHAPAENEQLEPNSDYAVAKAAATLLASHLGRERGLPVATLRLYSVFGPFEEPDRFIPTLVVHALRGQLPPLVDPAIARDFVYLDDVVEAFLLTAARGSHRATCSTSERASKPRSRRRSTRLGGHSGGGRGAVGVDERARLDTRRWVSDPTRSEPSLVGSLRCRST